MFYSPFTHQGTKYTCVEQMFQAEKAILFGDTKSLTSILAEHDPKKQKALGRKVTPFDEVIWEERQ